MAGVWQRQWNHNNVGCYEEVRKGARLRSALNVARAARVGTKPVPLEAAASRLSRYRGSDRNAPLTVIDLFSMKNKSSWQSSYQVGSRAWCIVPWKCAQIQAWHATGSSCIQLKRWLGDRGMLGTGAWRSSVECLAQPSVHQTARPRLNRTALMTSAPAALTLVALAGGSSASTSLPFRRMAISTSMRSSNAANTTPAASYTQDPARMLAQGNPIFKQMDGVHPTGKTDACRMLESGASVQLHSRVGRAHEFKQHILRRN